MEYLCATFTYTYNVVQYSKTEAATVKEYCKKHMRIFVAN